METKQETKRPYHLFSDYEQEFCTEKKVAVENIRMQRGVYFEAAHKVQLQSASETDPDIQSAIAKAAEWLRRAGAAS